MMNLGELKENINQAKAYFQRLDIAPVGSAVLWLILILMSFVFVRIMVSDDMARTVSDWLGIYSDGDRPPRHETLKFIGFMMGGVLAAIGAIAINRRAEAQTESAKAQVKSAKAQTENNELIQKRRDDARFQSITENLGHPKASVRIAAFYRFYYYASKEGQSDQFKKDVFEILCSYLRTMPKETSECKKKQEEYEMERQTLFNVLFKDKFKSKKNGLIPDNVPADLRNIHLDEMELGKSNLSGANLFSANLSGAFLSGANLSSANLVCANLTGANLLGADLSKSIFIGTNLSRANLEDANFQGAELKRVIWENINTIRGADFRGATILGKPIKRDDIPDNKGEYYANWNPPPEKEENQDIMSFFAQR